MNIPPSYANLSFVYIMLYVYDIVINLYVLYDFYNQT